jgi:hypothetical protein
MSEETTHCVATPAHERVILEKGTHTEDVVLSKVIRLEASTLSKGTAHQEDVLLSETMIRTEELLLLGDALMWEEALTEVQIIPEAAEDNRSKHSQPLVTFLDWKAISLALRSTAVLTSLRILLTCTTHLLLNRDSMATR